MSLTSTDGLSSRVTISTSERNFYPFLPFFPQQRANRSCNWIWCSDKCAEILTNFCTRKMPSLPKPVSALPDQSREKSWTLKSTICVARHGDRTPKCECHRFDITVVSETDSRLWLRQTQVQLQRKRCLECTVYQPSPRSHDRDYPSRSRSTPIHRRRSRRSYWYSRF